MEEEDVLLDEISPLDNGLSLQPQDGLQAQPVTLNRDEMLRAYLTPMYVNSEKDDSEIQSARERANDNNFIANMGQALGQLATSRSQAFGGKGVDPGVFDNIRKQGEQQVASATMNKKANEADKMKAIEVYLRGKESDQRNALRGKELEQRAIENKNRQIDNKLRTQILADRAAKLKDPTQSQFSAGSFGKRIEAANSILDELEGEGYDRTSRSSALGASLPGFLQGDQSRRQENAERMFTNAKLRRDSGASISATEYESTAKEYFPRAGDTPEVLAQKKQAREQVLAGLKAEAARSWDLIPAVERVKPKKGGDIFGASETAYAADPSAISEAPKQWKKGDIYTDPKGNKYIFNGKDFDLSE